MERFPRIDRVIAIQTAATACLLPSFWLNAVTAVTVVAGIARLNLYNHERGFTVFIGEKV